MQTKFEWGETMSCPTGYPVETYRGGLISEDGNYTSLFLGLHKGPWGSSGRSMRKGVKSLPKRIETIWIAYAEDAVYEIDTEINYDKILKLFNEGFYVPSMSNSNPEPRKENFSEVNVGFAPGGMVVIWISGMGRQVEIGRYQGKKIEIPEEEIEALDASNKLLFSDEHREYIMTNEAVIPAEMQNEEHSKSIPYDLWDSYREEYNWNYEFSFPNNGKLKEIYTFYYNEDQLEAFGPYLIEKYGASIPDKFKWSDSTINNRLPRRVRIRWVDGLDDSKTHMTNINFDAQEITDAFTKTFKKEDKKDVKATLKIYINELNSYPSINLSSEGKEVPILNAEIKMSSTK